MMTFHPESLKLEGSLKEKNDLVKERTVLYDGKYFDAIGSVQSINASQLLNLADR